LKNDKGEVHEALAHDSQFFFDELSTLTIFHMDWSGGGSQASHEPITPQALEQVHDVRYGAAYLSVL
jgi:beta-xylosidase